MNKVTLIGRLTANPEVKDIPDGKKVLQFTVAVKRNYKADTSDFIRCEAWNKTAELIGKYLKKGDPIALEGEWNTGSYQNKDGATVYTNICNVTHFEFVPQSPKNNVAEPGSTPAAVIAAAPATPFTSAPFDTRYL